MDEHRGEAEEQLNKILFRIRRGDGVAVQRFRDGAAVQKGAFLARDLKCGMFVAVH